MARPSVERELSNLPAWRGWVLIIGTLLSLAALAAWLLPSPWRSAEATPLLALNVIQLGNCALLVAVYGGRSGAGRAERLALDLAIGLFALMLADSILRQLGHGFVPAAWKGGLTVAALVLVMVLLLARDVRRRLEEARPRRIDIAMGE